MGASFAYGVTDHVEIGSRIWGIPTLTEWTWGGELQTKVQVVRPESASGAFQLSLAPRLSFHQFLLPPGRFDSRGRASVCLVDPFSPYSKAVVVTSSPALASV